MGKREGRPVNASLSITLSGAGSTTELRKLNENGPLSFTWNQESYVPPVLGQKKAEDFLRNETIWRDGLSRLGYPFLLPRGQIEIKTLNSVPAATGMATSASGFAALTLAWLEMLLKEHSKEWTERFNADALTRAIVADLTRHGSGSACRSIDGHIVEWHPELGAKPQELTKINFVDFILLLDPTAKIVSSSEAHARVLSSPLFEKRPERANARLVKVKSGLMAGDLNLLSETVLEEALDMHELFHTANPPFQYMNESTKAWINRFKNQGHALPAQNAIVTLDAGANLHVFVPESGEALWDDFFSSQKELQFSSWKSGKGARYLDAKEC